MNLAIGTVAAQFLSWKCMFRIFGIVSLQCVGTQLALNEVNLNRPKIKIETTTFLFFIRKRIKFQINHLTRLFLKLKVHKHEIILNFFLTKIKSLYSLGKFSKKISLLFLWFSPEFRSSNIFAVTEHTRNQILLERYPKIFFLQNVHLGPIR